MKKPQGAGFYTKIYQKIAAGETDLAKESYDWIMARYEFIAPFVVGDSVLDLGCGIGYIADMIGGRQYLGVDFSRYAVKYSREVVQNPKARFLVRDLQAVSQSDFRAYDTVLVLEILEHVADPKQLAALAMAWAKKRVIATVPRDMPGTAHVWPTWGHWMAKCLFGRLSRFELFGGRHDDSWYLIIKDIG